MNSCGKHFFILVWGYWKSEAAFENTSGAPSKELCGFPNELNPESTGGPGHSPPAPLSSWLPRKAQEGLGGPRRLLRLQRLAAGAAADPLHGPRRTCAQ